MTRKSPERIKFHYSLHGNLLLNKRKQENARQSIKTTPMTHEFITCTSRITIFFADDIQASRMHCYEKVLKQFQSFGEYCTYRTYHHEVNDTSICKCLDSSYTKFLEFVSISVPSITSIWVLDYNFRSPLCQSNE